ncbi:hypothetical protein KFE19_00030 [Dysosmobacter sp. Marseille-Q4140]|nr:hypothetical protein KFE19_00030 [Dysosmobacter sp. Marseille-Q4140]
MAKSFDQLVKEHGSVAAAMQAQGYTKNESGSWTNAGRSGGTTSGGASGGTVSGAGVRGSGGSGSPSYSSNVDYHQQAIDAASRGDWAGVNAALSARQQKINAQGGNDRGQSNQSIYQSLLAQYGSPSGGSPSQGTMSRDEMTSQLYAGNLVGQSGNYFGQGWSEGQDYLALALEAAGNGNLTDAYTNLQKRGYKMADTGSSGGGTSQAQAYQLVQQAFDRSGELERQYEISRQKNAERLAAVARSHDGAGQSHNAYKTVQRMGSDGVMYYVTMDGNGNPVLASPVGNWQDRSGVNYTPEEIDALADYYANGFDLNDYYTIHNYAVDRVGNGAKYDENGILQLNEEDFTPRSLIPQLQALGINPILNSQLAGLSAPQASGTADTAQGQAGAVQSPGMSVSDWNALLLGQMGLTGGTLGNMGQLGGSQAYPDAPEYTPMYESEISALIQKILGSSYQDFRQGDEYDRLYDQYSANGQKAMQDTLGQLAARTGGYASSYASASAGQAFNDYMTTLEEAARAMYQDQLNQQLQNLGVLTDAENTNYNQYLNELSQWNTDRDFDYNQYMDQLNLLYQLGRDQVEDQRYQDETDYNQALLQAETLAAYGDFSGYKALGYSDAQIQQMRAAYQSQAAAQSSGKKSSSSSGGSSGTSKPRLTAAQTLTALENGLRNQQVLDAYEYYYGEPFQEPSETGGDTGMNPDHYRAFGNSIMAQLNAGKENAAIGNIDARWDEMNEEQRAGIQNLLKQYGYQYSAS